MRLKRFVAPFLSIALGAAPAMPTLAQTPTEAPVEDVDASLLGEGIVATVNDELITSFDLRQRMLLLILTSQIQPTEENLPAIQEQALRLLIDQRLQAQELRRMQVNIPDEDVNAEIAAIAEEAGVTADVYLAGMAEFGITADTVRENLRTDIGWRALVNGRYRDRARVGNDQIDAVLARIEDAATRRQWLIGEIYIDAAQVGGMERAMAGANQLVQQILQGAPFQAVARQFSQAPSAASGGDGGWVVDGESPASVQAALNQMDPGQLSRPIAVDGGVYIILLRDERSGSVSTLVNLRQAAIRLEATASEAEVAAADQRLRALRPTLTCDNILSQSGDGLVASDLGEANIADLAAQFQPVAASGAVGTISEPIRTPLGLHLVAVCGRRQASDEVPSRDQIRNQLAGQQLNMLARRYIRDLRNAATIETRTSN